MQKAIKSRVLTILSTRTGASIFLAGVFACIYVSLSIFDGLIESVNQSLTHIHSPSSYQSVSPSVATTDNLHGRSFDRDLLVLPIDIIYTWVNGSDERLIEQLHYFQNTLDNDGMTELSTHSTDTSIDHSVDEIINESNNQTSKSANETVGQPPKSTNDSLADSLDHVTANRFRDNSELLYSLRSIWKFAGWARHIYIITNGQVPYWLNLNHPRLTLLQHSDIFPNKSHLPTFSSPAIESHLHHIPGLSNYSIYFNDDVMLGNDVYPDDFFSPNLGYKVYLSWNVPHCVPGCPDTWITDGYCDAACNNAACKFDGGDCVNTTSAVEGRINSWENSARSKSTSALNTARYCASGCPNNWIGDKVCDRSCKNDACAFDGGDCGLELLQENVLALQLDPINQTTNEPINQPIIFDLPYDQRTFFINLTAMFPGTVNEASHNNPELVRSAVVTQAIKTLAFILFAEEEFDEIDLVAMQASMQGGNTSSTQPTSQLRVLPPHNIEVFLSGEHEGINHNITFNITRSRVLPNQPISSRRLMSDLHSIHPPSQHSITPSSVDESVHLDDSWFISSNDWRDVPNVLIEAIPLITDGIFTAVIPQNDWSLADNEVADRLLVLKKKQLWVEAQQRHQSNAVKLVQRAIKLKQQVQSVDQSVDKAVEQSADPYIQPSIQQSADASGDKLIDQDSLTGLWPWELSENVDQWDRTWGVVDEIHQSINQPSSILDTFLDLIKSSTSTTRPISHLQRSSHKRRLLDTYGSSLRYVNSLLHELYGKEVRKAPAHMPHFMDKRIMSELQSQWPAQYDLTSSNRFRTSADMQHAFAYFYYIIHARQTFNIDEVWNQRLDVDGNGRLDEREIKTLALFVADTLLNDAEIAAVKDMLVNCSYARYPEQLRNHSSDELSEQSSDEFKPLPLIDVSVLSQCQDIIPALTERVITQPKYKHRIESLNEVEFFMVPDNVTVVARRLDQIAMKRPKFICLNDNMNKTSSTSPIDTLKRLHDFYQTYFPLPSPFELPPGQLNGYRYIDEWRADQLQQQTMYHTFVQSIALPMAAVIGGCVLVLVCLWFMWPNKRASKLTHARSRSMNRRGVMTSTIV